MAQPQVQSQAQHQAPPQPASTAQYLKSLRETVDKVLIESGKTLRQTGNASSPANAIALTKFKTNYPKLLGGYHETLNRLEDEIAKTTMTLTNHGQIFARDILRRDLAIAQEERVKREEAAAAEKQKQQQKANEKPPAPPQPSTNTNSAASVPKEPASKPSEPDSNKRKEPEVTQKQEKASADNKTEVAPSAASHTLSLPAGQASEAANKTSNAVLVNVPASTTSAAAPTDPTPTSAGLKDFDFDSMFPDSIDNTMDANNAGNDIDFNMGLSGDTSIGNNTTDDPAQTSMDSLLQGIESYANSLGDGLGANDISMTDVPSTSAEATQGDLTQTNATAGDDPLNELFSFADFEAGEDNNNNMSTEFDDLFFND
ncbi:MAG: hypothetical protein M1820_001933 [Bogoriella megaspora]|nr:MAG: hypothetical protein M1820_001933 [Bogoriella megaspora]